MSGPKQEVISFKVDGDLGEALRGMPNRSSFIRNALLAALEGACPLCRGTGILTPEQRQHWDRFSRTHQVRECDQCRAWHLVCVHDQGRAESHGARQQ